MLQKASLPSTGFPYTSTNANHRGRKKEPHTMHEIIISPDETILEAPLDMLEYFESEKPIHVSNIHLIDNALSPLIGTLAYGDKSLEVDLSPGEETRYFLHLLYKQGYHITETEEKEEVINTEYYEGQDVVIGILDINSLGLRKQ